MNRNLKRTFNLATSDKEGLPQKAYLLFYLSIILDAFNTCNGT